MKLVYTLAASLLLVASMSAMAQDAPPADGKGRAAGHYGMQPQDCSKAATDMKERCEMRNKALEKCKDKKHGEEHRQCMMEQRPKKDGTKDVTKEEKK